MENQKILNGLTRSGEMPPVTNPGDDMGRHAPLQVQNRVRMQVWGPEEPGGEVVLKEEREHIGNIMATFGLNRLCELVATGGEASDWISVCRIGTHTQAEDSSDDTLGASTGSVVITNASMALSDAGDRTAEYQMTFASDNPPGAAEIHEIGLFCNSTAHSEMAARSELGTDSVNKGSADTISASYQIIFSTG